MTDTKELIERAKRVATSLSDKHWHGLERDGYYGPKEGAKTIKRLTAELAEAEHSLEDTREAMRQSNRILAASERDNKLLVTALEAAEAEIERLTAALVAAHEAERASDTAYAQEASRRSIAEDENKRMQKSLTVALQMHADVVEENKQLKAANARLAAILWPTLIDGIALNMPPIHGPL